MSYSATVYEVMVAAPSDIKVEKQIISEIINEWNVVHSKDKSVILMAVDWESHSSPSMGDRPQAILNKQILKDADILVAVFWTRIGSPTGESRSGTVEEIEKHIAAGKPTMIYFSSAPVPPDSVDDEQYNGLKDFKAGCRLKGIIEEYRSTEEFKDKFRRQLTRKIIEYCSAGTDQNTGDGVVPEQAQSTISALSNEARELLVNAAMDPRGIVAKFEAMKGTSIQTNGKDFNILGDPRSTALWQDALDQLCYHDLLRYSSGVVYEVTKAGYALADKLSGN